MTTSWVAICQYCGKQGSLRTTSNGKMPTSMPSISGKCLSHPSGKPNMPHNPKWQKR